MKEKKDTIIYLLFSLVMIIYGY